MTALSDSPDSRGFRLLSSDPAQRKIAYDLYQGVKDLPIVSPHGHCDPRWFAANEPFSGPTQTLIAPDHYVLRMLHSQGIDLRRLPDPSNEEGARALWKIFADNLHLFWGTPSKVWFDQILRDGFGIADPLSSGNAREIYDEIDRLLQLPEFLPRALFERFKIRLLATTESPLDELESHRRLKNDGWGTKICTTYRPDSVVDPEYAGFRENVERLGVLTDEDVSSFSGYLRAHRVRRRMFIEHGAFATDHGHPTPRTADLNPREAGQLYHRVFGGRASPEDAELFRAQMLTEMALMSLEDGLTMQIHPGVERNHNQALYKALGPDIGGDIPRSANYVDGLRPLLGRVGNEASLRIILFTLDETTYTRELAPLAGHYPCLYLGPAWWFLDSPEGMLRMKRSVFETAGFFNTAGFNDDTRAFFSLPARHDMARRIDCRHLAELIADQRLTREEAMQLAPQLAGGLALRAYGVPHVAESTARRESA